MDLETTKQARQPERATQATEVFQKDETQGVLCVFNTHGEAEEAVRLLSQGGFEMRKISIIGRDYHTEEDVIGFYSTGDRVKYWGKMGAFWGGLWGLLVGSAFLVIPGVGPLVIAGTFGATLIAALEGAVVVGGLSALGGALYSMGVPKNSVVQYETAIKAGKFLMVVRGTPEEAQKAREILKTTGALQPSDFEIGGNREERPELTH